MEICRLEHIRKDYHMGELVTPLKDVTLTVNSGTLNQVFAGSNNNSDASSGSIKTSLSGGTGRLTR